KLGGVDLTAIENLIKEGRQAVEKQDDEKVQEVSAKLEKEAHAMAAKLYESASTPGGPGAPGAGGGDGAGSADKPGEDKKKDNVIDAEFEESQ
ncbi:MAG TPA: molecular chaperone DnaK, partial [Polyangiaceae bacterium]|nr:molecular chaperone DnaK [Polyangiaceae bacterium]